MPTGFGDLGGPGNPIAGFYGAEADLLSDFYIPLLERSRRYDRVSGYFTSWGIVAAAQGLARFLPNGGSMRLVVGAQLDPGDVAAIETPADLEELLVDQLSGNGALDPDLGDLIAQRRREILAWLVAEKRCEIKVGLRRGPDGKPVPAVDDPNYFHHKLGVFDDGQGRRIAFSGSGNETWSGWVGNSESFTVVASWWGDDWWAAQGGKVVDQIDRMWKGDAGGDWMTVDLPVAVRDRLVKYAPASMPPAHDPAEKPQEPKTIVPVLKPDPAALRGRLAELLERLRTQMGSGIRTAGVEPMPHQVSILHRAIDRWPRGHLYADEVGLGKTIEVGLTVREAVVREQATRVLFLVPAAVIGQWQEELAEKLALWVPRWEGPTIGWRWPDNTTSDPADGDPWATAHPITLVSSHLARMRRNRPQILASGPWDVVAVDEAHHARRRGGRPDGEPNLLLSLLHDMRAEQSWGTLLLATATPMQMHPHELWDLVDLFQLPGAWAEEPKYERYYDEVRRQDFGTRNWRFLSSMAKDHREDHGRLDPVLDAEIQTSVAEGRLAIRQFGKREIGQAWATGVPEENRRWVDAWLLTNNPVRDRLFRNTRTTLRAYREAGLLHETIPDRVVDDEFLEMSEAERAVYRRIRDYIRRHYDAAMSAGGTRKGLGFIMTVYRRRLTSSFLAIQRSLERRLDVLEGRRLARELVDEDDMTLFDETPDIDWNATRTVLLDGEIGELRSFIAGIEALQSPETKLATLMERIVKSFDSGHRTVLVFTQYADTVDLLARELNGRWPGQVLAYTSGGGRLYDPGDQRWDAVDKVTAKSLFRAGDDVKILVGTDTLAEGLNLQTCGRLFNYDMPWNFTRVEQRIGRVDRIGGHERVEVTNLFYSRTVEATIYRSLVSGFGGFDFIVGDAQPVLGDIEAAIQQAAFSDDEDQLEEVDANHDTLFGISAGLVANIRVKIAEAQAEAMRLSDLDDAANGDAASDQFGGAVTLEELAEVLLNVPEVRSQLEPHPTVEGAWLLKDDIGFTRSVTLERAVLAELSPDVRLLSPGDPLFDLVIASASAASDATSA